MKVKKLLPCLILTSVVCLGLFLRLRHWPNYLTFDYEKARDLIASINIFLQKKPTLLGPVSEVEGIFHGPLYYYLVGFCYFVFKGDPRAGSVVSFFFNLSSIPILFFIGKKLFNARVGLIGALIYAVSFEAISYAYWLSNPGPSVPFLFLMFFFFHEFCTKKETYLIPALFCLGIAIQFQILNIIFIFPLAVLFFVLGKPKIRIKTMAFSLAVFITTLFSFLLFEVRHKFLMTNAFIHNYILPEKSAGISSIKFNFFQYFERLINEFSQIIFPTNRFASLIIFIIIIVFILRKIFKKRQTKIWTFMAVWIFSTIPIFLINSRMSQSHAAFIGISGAVILCFAYLTDQLYCKTNKWILLVVLIPIFISNLYATDNYLTNPKKRLFDFHEGLFLKTDMDIIKYTYKEANGADFTVDTLTSPLSISPLWDYLYEWYAGKNSLKIPLRDTNTNIQFFIIEPIFIIDVSGSETFKRNFVRDKKQDIADMENKLFFGQIEVQKWISKTKKN